jgi:hypothetical protein
VGWKTQSNLNFVENVGQPWAFGFHVPNVDFRTLETPFSVLKLAEGFTVEQVIGLLDKKYGHRV